MGRSKSIIIMKTTIIDINKLDIIIGDINIFIGWDTYHIQHKTDNQVIFEYPENNLFPAHQKEMVESIVKKYKNKNIQVIILTHSPYILTSFNNLIYAGNVKQSIEELGNEDDLKQLYSVIPKDHIIPSGTVNAYELDKGKVKRSILSKTSKLINDEIIDNVSEIIGEEFDQLVNLKLKVG